MKNSFLDFKIKQWGVKKSQVIFKKSKDHDYIYFKMAAVGKEKNKSVAIATRIEKFSFILRDKDYIETYIQKLMIEGIEKRIINLFFKGK